MRKIYLFLLTLFCAVGASAQIAELSGISNDKCYTVKSQGRGYLYYDGTYETKMASSSRDVATGSLGTENVTPTPSDPNHQIAILRTNLTAPNNYYLYSVGAGKFLSYSGSGAAVSLTATPYAWELTKVTDASVNYFTIKIPLTTQTYINVTNNANGADNGCKIAGTDADGGNRMVITEAEAFNSTTAMAAITEFEASFVNYTVSLSGAKWIQVGEKADFLHVATSADDNSHWYIMQQARGGLTPMYDNGAGNTMRRAASGFTPNNKQVSGNEKYLVRFIQHSSGNGYVMQFATGNYVREVTTTAYPTQEGRYLLYNINGENGHIGWNKTTDGTTYGSIVDNNGANADLAFWGSGQVTAVTTEGSSGVNNNVWSLYRVTFQDDVPVGALEALINESSTYTANAGKPGYVTTEWVNNSLNPAITGARNALTGNRDEINTAYANLNNTITNKEIALPTAGRFYRIQNESATAYLVSGTGTGKAQFDRNATANSKNNVFYYDGTRLLSYDNGYYLSEKNYGGNPFVNYTETLGEGAATIFTFAASPVYGKLLIKFSNGSRALYSAGAGDSNAADAGQTGQHYRFAVTEVEWLPVPMNTTEGYRYATLYSPVQLGLGDGSDRVEVYTVSSAAGTTATLSKQQTCVPANTGVILKYKEGIQSNGCVYLPIQATTEENVTSLLRGSLADKLVGDDAYVLSKPANGTIGLYKATKNQDGNTWLNQGFHAYLPANYITGIGGARVLTFNFDDNAETGISAVEIEEAAPANAAIYDLSGRRVQNAKSGLYIINGKKVIK